MRAAVPDYVGSSLAGAPPGHRFRMYFPIWKDDWNIEREKKEEALRQVVDMKHFRDMAPALAARGPAAGSRCLAVHARSTAPVVTGMGMEHPLENGFAFLDPYGLPYLPGSSVKGVLRRAAEELALFEEDPRGWTLAAAWWLFGFDGSSGFLGAGDTGEPAPVRRARDEWRRAFEERGGDDTGSLLTRFRERFVPPGDEHPVRDNREFLERLAAEKAFRRSVHVRGSVSFLDVVPVPKGGEPLRVDVMNPHHARYYKGDGSPHDAEDPNPIFFLAIPAGWSFTFRAVLVPVAGLPDWLVENGKDDEPRWRSLLVGAFEHAFRWLGFGAKTSVGYGAMTRDRVAEKRAEDERRRREEEEEDRRRRQELENMPPLERALAKIENATPEEFGRLMGEVLEEFQEEETQRRLAEAMKQWLRRHGKWKAKKKTKWATRVERVKGILGE